MPELIGLVACGGKSTRMGKDKLLLQYFEKPQYAHVFEMLKKNCTQVYISCRTEQTDKIGSNFPCIVDLPLLSEIGPMAALLSAHQKFPEASFLLLGCDYPYLLQSDVEKLVKSRNTEYEAVCYFHPESKMEEPLLAIYENSCLEKLKQNQKNGNHSLRFFLKEINTLLVTPEAEVNLTSIDSIQQIENSKKLKQI